MKKNSSIIYMVLFSSLIFMQTQQGLAGTDQDSTQSVVKIAVAAENSIETSEISDKAGRAPFFLIFDGSGAFIEAIENPAQNQQGGASASVTALLEKASVNILVAANFGTKMENNLKAAGIEYHEHSGIAKKVVETLIKNNRNKDANQ